MKNCEFCELDKSQVYNTIIEETKNFYIKVSLGAIVEGYILIISKKHINSMQELNENERIEYLDIIKKYRNRFFEKYNKFPIVFEHGTSKKQELSASSIVHAHTHIVNHNYFNEENILKKLNLKKINSDFNLEINDKSYIFYISPNGESYITYDFKPISQIMRIFIARDLNMEDKYDWKKNSFIENIVVTINKLKRSDSQEVYNTIDYYNKNAKEYFEQTIKGNFKENYDRFLSRISDNSYILDFGCGSGRDSKYFIEKGYKVKAIDGSEEMCKLASKYIAQNVKCMKFSELDEKDTYDAIWACASILHVTKEEFPSILSKMINALKEKGIIYMAFKKGQGYKVIEGKYYNFLNREELEKILEESHLNIKIVDYFETISSTTRPEKVIWSNYILQK
ncbi:MAG: methyltransferase domain-containing protein [Clostridia bacterium]|nr:methyltransferase domain-containing protein [Clostridia bacterium]